MDFHSRLEQPPKVKFYARVSSRVPFVYLKDEPNLAFLSGRPTSSSDLASYALSRSSSVQRSFFRGDVIEITSWAPDVHVVNLVCPFLIYRRGIFFRCEFQSSKFIHDMDPPGHGHHACTNSTQNTLKWLDEQNNGLFGVLLSGHENDLETVY